MDELESSLHLAQRPLYIGEKGIGRQSFLEAVDDCREELTWDPAAILSIASFGYACGERTLVNEIKRRPWLSEIGTDSKVHLKNIPPHGRLWTDYDKIATNLIRLLCDEAIQVCRGHKEIYVLLSGGLDSRVVAGVLANIQKQGMLDVRPVCVTWG